MEEEDEQVVCRGGGGGGGDVTLDQQVLFPYGKVPRNIP